MSFHNDSVNEDGDVQGDGSVSASPSVISSVSSSQRRFGPAALACLLAVAGGYVVYRYWGSGGGPTPQTAGAAPNVRITPTPAAPKPKVSQDAEPWVNPAFKDLTPEAAIEIRARVAGEIIDGFFDAGNAVGQYVSSLSERELIRRGSSGTTRIDQPSNPEKAPTAPAPPKAKPKPTIFASALAAGVDASLFKLNGIMYNGPDSMAVINEGVYRIGQKVSGAVVRDITQKDIVLHLGDKTFRVGM